MKKNDLISINFKPLSYILVVLYEEPGNLASGQSGEIMRQDQVMHRISLPSTIMTCSGKFSDVSYNVPVFKEVLIPIKPSEGKELYTNKSHGGSGKQCLELSISSRSSEGSYLMVSHKVSFSVHTCFR